MDTSYLMAELRGLVSQVGCMLAEHFPARNERQDFIDRAAIEIVANQWHLSSETSYLKAEDLWEARQRQRGLPSERERVVYYLNRMEGGGGFARSLADAIKAGKHLEPRDDGVGEKFSG